MAPFSTASNATPSRSSPALVAPTPTLLNEPSPRTSDLDSSPTLARSEGASLHRVGDDDGPIRKVDEDDPVDVKDRPRSTSSADGEPKVDVGRGAHMRGGDVQMSLPKNNMPLVMFALALTMFIAALDQTIVTTALPAITAELKGSGSSYAWVGTSYMLAASALTPMWGKLSDIVGRKMIYYPSIFAFLLGSILCATAKNMNWLIGARAIQGLGGGGIMTMTNVVLGDIVTLQDRGKYSAVLGGTWGIASVVGPLVGGLLTDKASWRWNFWINLPLGAIAVPMLFFCLHLNPHHTMNFPTFLRQFDFAGIFLLTAGAGALLAGFSFASDKSWSDKTTIALVVSGIVLFALGIVNENYTNRLAVLPPRLMATRTTLLLFLIVLLHGLAFMSVTYWLPLYYQGVFGTTALLSGIQMLPVSLGSSIMTLAVGPLVSRYSTPRPFMWIGLAGTCLGFGLLFLLDEKTSLAGQEGIPIVAGLFIGFLFQPPMIAMQAAMPLKDMASSTSAFMLCRSFGVTLGVSVSGTILFTRLRSALPPPSDAFPASSIEEILTGDFKSIAHISDPVLRQEVRTALADSLRVIWMVVCPLIGLAFIMSCFLRHYTLVRNYSPTSAPAAAAAEVDAEKGGPVLAGGAGASKIEEEEETVELDRKDGKATS